MKKEKREREMERVRERESEREMIIKNLNAIINHD